MAKRGEQTWNDQWCHIWLRFECSSWTWVYFHTVVVDTWHRVRCLSRHGIICLCVDGWDNQSGFRLGRTVSRGVGSVPDDASSYRWYCSPTERGRGSTGWCSSLLHPAPCPPSARRTHAVPTPADLCAGRHRSSWHATYLYATRSFSSLAEWRRVFAIVCRRQQQSSPTASDLWYHHRWLLKVIKVYLFFCPFN